MRVKKRRKKNTKSLDEGNDGHLVGRPILFNQSKNVLQIVANVLFWKKKGVETQKGKKREEIGQTINYLLDNGDQLTQLVKVKLNHSLWAAAHHAHERRHDLGEEGHALQTKSFEDEHHCLNHSSVVSAQRRVAQDLHQGYEAEKEKKVRTH